MGPAVLQRRRPGHRSAHQQDRHREPLLARIRPARHQQPGLDATSQAVTKRYTTPFGASRTGGTGTWPDDKAFLGKSADSSSSLTYVGAREYDPVTGRFLSVDPVLDTSDTQSLNGYTYADNSPVTQSDPTGLESCGPAHYCSGSNGTYGTYHEENDPGSKKYRAPATTATRTNAAAAVAPAVPRRAIRSRSRRSRRASSARRPNVHGSTHSTWSTSRTG
ncbi:RHS repeat-associated core domain-containing protein [Streptomyces sp. 900105755]